MKAKRIKVYNNLLELLNGEGAETPWQFGRMLYKYTDCGPWVKFELDKERIVQGKRMESVYYEDEAASVLTWAKHCTGISIGSIVEGSDAEIGPEYLEFPFTEEQLRETVKGVNQQANDEWQTANTEYFCLQHDGDNSGNVTWTQFDDAPVWDEDEDSPLPTEVKAAWVKWYTEGRWHDGMARVEYDKPLDFGVPGWACIQYVVDAYC